MTKAEKRVAVAKDVIAQLNRGKLTATTGLYFEAKNCDKSFDGEVQLQEVLKHIPKCEVCAKGALFVGMINKYNDFTINVDYYTNYPKASQITSCVNIHFYDKLKTLFTEKQLTAIEVYFEGWRRVKAPSFYEKNPNAKKRMILIMKNIIQNKGTFKPSLLK